MIERLEIIQNRYNELVEELGKPEVLADYTKTMELSKEKGRLETTVNKYKELRDTQEEIEGLKDMVNDPEMGEMARLELEENQSKLPRATARYARRPWPSGRVPQRNWRWLSCRCKRQTRRRR